MPRIWNGAGCLAWVVAWAGLSAAFSLDDGRPPDDALRVAELAAVELSR